MKQCTVLGGRGYIGRNLTTYLRSLGHEVFVPERSEILLTRKSLGHVFYCIGITADFRTRPYDTVRAHVEVLSEVLEHADFDSLLYLSSTRIYNSAESGHEESSFMVNPTNPSDLYNISKLMGESLCLTACQNKVRIVRLANVVGRQDSDSDNFLAILSRDAKLGKIVLRTALTSSKDYIHIDDVVEILANIAFLGRYPIYNVASGIQVTHAQIINLLKKLSGCTVEVYRDAPEIVFPEIDISRIREEFDFRQKDIINIFSSIEEM